MTWHTAAVLRSDWMSWLAVSKDISLEEEPVSGSNSKDESVVTPLPFHELNVCPFLEFVQCRDTTNVVISWATAFAFHVLSQMVV